MSAPAREISLDQWIEYCNTLRPIENFLLIGLLSRESFTSIEAVKEAPLATAENWRDAKRWVLKYLRPSLDLYCRKKPWVTLTEKLTSAALDSLKYFIPVIAASVNLPVGIAVALTFWLLRRCLDQWCGKYAARILAGDGRYTSASGIDYPQVFFELEYRPPILEWVDDEAAYPLSVPKEEIWIPAEVTGDMRLGSRREVEEIIFTFDAKVASRYSFVDRKSKQAVGGSPSNVVPSERGQNVLGIVGESLELGPLSA